MAKNEPNKPEEIETGPANEIQPEEITAPPIEPAAEVVVSFDKINEILSERQTAAKDAEKAAEVPKETEAPAPDKAPEEKAARKGRPPKADKADKEPKPEKAPKAEKAVKPPKAAAEKKETPPPEPEKPPEPREAPRKDEQEQIVYINLSELHAFKNHPFQVRNDEEMAAMVESVKEKGVTQPAIVRPREDVCSIRNLTEYSDTVGYSLT